MDKRSALLLLGVTLTLIGLLAIMVGRQEVLQRLDEHPVWGLFTRQYRFLDRPGMRLVASGRQAFFRMLGLLFTVVGAGLVIAWAVGW